MRTTRARIAAFWIAAGSGAALVLAGSHSAEAQCLLESPTLDRSAVESSQCLACHAGSGGPAVSLHDSHPVERDYAEAWMARRGDLRAIPAPELALARGRVTCASCHDGASPHPHQTALPMASLCQGCHGL